MFRLLLTPALALLTLSTACKQRSFQDSRTQHFKSVNFFETEESPGRAPGARTAAGLSEGQILARRHRSTLGNLRHTEVVFKGLTVEQAKALKALYSSPEGAWSVTEENRLAGPEVSIFGFMPPIVQSSAGLIFEKNEENTSQLRLEMRERGIADYPGTLRTVTNCWGTAWEFLRLARAPRPAMARPGESLGKTALFYVADGMLAALRKPEHSTLLATKVSPGRVAFSATSPDHDVGIRPGDALLMLVEPSNGGAEQLIHAAVAVDEGLYFEKVGVESHALYRTSYLEDILDMYGESGAGTVKLEWRRFAGTPLPHPADAFASLRQAESAGAPAQVTVSRRDQSVGFRIFEVDMSYNGETGRAEFQKEAFERGHFFHDKSCGDACLTCRIKVPTDDGVAEFEVPSVSMDKELLALVPRKIASGDRAVGRFPADGILMRKSGPGRWKSSWDGHEIIFEFSDRELEGTLDIDGVGESDPEFCRRIL